MTTPTGSRTRHRVADRLRVVGVAGGTAAPDAADDDAGGWTPARPAEPRAGTHRAADGLGASTGGTGAAPVSATPGTASDVLGDAPPPGGRWSVTVPEALAVAAASSVAGRPATGPQGVPGDACTCEAWQGAACACATADATPGSARFRWWPDLRTVVAAVVVLALVAGGIALRAATAPRGEPVPVPQPSGAPGAAPDAADAQVVVHVVGAVQRPGVVRLTLGARVAEALDAVGGASEGADLGAVNLARVLADGEQLVVPVVGEAPSEAAGALDDGLVDLNTADTVTLETLPGVGPVLAARIVEHRGERPFTTVDELDEVPGIGPALMSDLRPRVRV